MKCSIALLLLGTAAAVSAQTADNSQVSPSEAAAIAQETGSESWTYIKPDVSLSKYNAVLIKPTGVSDNVAAQFDGISTDDLWKFANIVTNALSSEISNSFKVVPTAAPRAIALQVTILGAKNTIGGVATATRLLPIGLAANVLKGATGKGGTLTGSLLVEVEITDAKTGELLAAAVRRRTPDPLDVEATLSTTDTVKSISRDMAKTLRERLVAANMPVRPGP